MLMGSSSRAAIVGVAESDLGYTPGKTVLQLQAQAARVALDDAGLQFNDVDALFCAGNWAWSPNLMLAEYLGIRPKYTDTTNIGGSSFEAHIGHAVAGIEAGLFEVALIAYGSTQRSDRSRGRGLHAYRLTEQYEGPFGLPTPVGAYALAAMRHMYEYGTTSEQLAEVAVATRKWAALNEKAMKREPITIEDVLNSLDRRAAASAGLLPRHRRRRRGHRYLGSARRADAQSAGIDTWAWRIAYPQQHRQYAGLSNSSGGNRIRARGVRNGGPYAGADGRGGDLRFIHHYCHPYAGGARILWVRRGRRVRQWAAQRARRAIPDEYQRRWAVLLPSRYVWHLFVDRGYAAIAR
jgi:hypothetical protein